MFVNSVLVSTKPGMTVASGRVISLGLALIGLGMMGFYWIPGLIAEDAMGSKIINSFYCSIVTLTTIGFGDICPDTPEALGRIFLTIYPIVGLGFFCGPVVSLTSSWRTHLPGGGQTAQLWLVVLTLALGVSMFMLLEDLSFTESLHFCVTIGTTIGYGDISPSSDLGRLMVAIYALLVLNVMRGMLASIRDYLESFCQVAVPLSLPIQQEVDDSDQTNKTKNL